MAAESDNVAESGVFNVPNQLTAARLALAVVVFVLLPLGYYIAAAVVFVIAASTDWVDGYWARKYNQVTQLGRIFDPFVDKIIICGTFIYLAAEGDSGSGIYPWMAVVVVGRELLVTVLRSYIEQHGGDFSASMAGKLKMVFQCVAAAASMIALAVGGKVQITWYGATGEPAWVFAVLVAFVWLSIISTVYSGVIYFFAAAKLLRS